ncbi:MAG: PDZ domain-containing protein [Actinobacteria bacterium]|uniref:Unannotated protein n=1 Tax=freshwater metagenome TaxID=449393 RepID=A0A6J6DPE4_9ZZZZ|nr:PDZ domain-containing protein [Actinomycetota bacterium]
MERSGPEDARDDAHDDPTDGSGAAPGRPDDHDPLRGYERFRGFRPFEGFDPFDDSDDSDDLVELYPPAPVPAHERTWRHPSELGLAAWQQTEPPVAIGRGLLVTTGAIGSALGVAVLYLMLPVGGLPSASPTATSSTALLRSPAVTVTDQPVATQLRNGGSPADADGGSPASTNWTDGPGVTLPSPDTPSTVLVLTPTAGPDDEPLSVAVAIEGAPYVVTTANAVVDDDDGVHLVAAAGPADGVAVPMDAAVVSVEGDLAFLEPSTALEVVRFAATAPLVTGQTLTVLADEPTEMALDDAAVAALDPAVIVEGTPVVDDDGALVALCTVTIDADGARVELIPVHGSTGVAPVDDTSGTTSTSTAPDVGTTPGTTVAPPPDPAPAAPSAPSGGVVSPTTPSTNTAVAPVATPSPAPTTTAAPAAWIGLRFDGAPASSPLTITGVVAGSPAMAAGVTVGERLVAVDGVEVRTVADVIDAIRSRAPGTVVRLTLASRSTSAGTSTSTTSPGSGTVATTTTTTAPASGGSAPAVPTTVPAGQRVVSVVLGSAAPTV